MPVVKVKNLSVEYEVEDGRIHAVDGVSFTINSDSIIGLLGESGSGKSTLSEAIVQILPENARITAGEIRFNGENLLEATPQRIRELRWNHVAYIPQSAMGSLDPMETIQDQMLEAVEIHEDSVSRSEALDRAGEMLDIVDIDRSYLESYPHQLSGGMRQRIAIAMSLILEPDLIIADEPTTGLDVIVRDQILDDIESIQSERDTSFLIVTHDVSDLVETCDSLLVMFGGKIVESGPSRQLFDEPTHPYTIGLRGSLPTIHSDPSELITMEMDPPDLRTPTDGCRFSDRCPYDVPECRESHPPLQAAGDDLKSACYRSDEAEMLRSEANTVTWTNE